MYYSGIPAAISATNDGFRFEARSWSPDVRAAVRTRTYVRSEIDPMSSRFFTKRCIHFCLSELSFSDVNDEVSWMRLRIYATGNEQNISGESRSLGSSEP